MKTRMLVAALAAAALLCPGAGIAQTQPDVQTQIQQIQDQLKDVDGLKARLADLEKKLADTQKAQQAPPPAVATGYPDVKAKLDGRIFAGIFASGKNNGYPNWSTDVPDAKLRFTFSPAKNVTVVNRLNISGIKPVDFDYFYADFARTLGPFNVLRLGQRKIDVGQETWVDNPVENMLITNSVSHVSGYGTGLATLGRLGGAVDAPVYELGFVNGPKGVTTRPSSGLPVNAKLGVSIATNLFASASYFTTGRLGPNDLSAISVAEINSAPAGAAAWKRNLWEMDLRYNYGPTGIRNLVPTGVIPPLMLGATYGRFDDSAEGAPGRNGSYWFAEGLVKLSPKLYAAARYSATDLDDSSLAKLGKSPVAVNSYSRTSIGVTCVLTNLIQWKTEYTINNTSGGATEPSLNQWATGVAAKF